MSRNRLPVLLVALMTTIGCRDQAAQIAHEAAERQALQNLEMSKLHQGVVSATEQLHQERAQLNQGRDALEAERRAIVSDRRSESAIAVLGAGGGIVLVALFALALAWVVVNGGRGADEDANVLCEVLAGDLSSELPQLEHLLGRDGRRAIAADPPTESQELS